MSSVYDWDILEIEGVTKVAERAALKVAEKWVECVEYEDLLQEAALILASHADARTVLREGGLGRLHHWLWCDLTDLAKSQNRRTQLNFSFDELKDETVET